MKFRDVVEELSACAQIHHQVQIVFLKSMIDINILLK